MVDMNREAAEAALKGLEKRRQSPYASREDKDLPTYKRSPGRDWKTWLAVCTTAEQKVTVVSAVEGVIYDARQNAKEHAAYCRKFNKKLAAAVVAYEAACMAAGAKALADWKAAAPDPDSGRRDLRGSPEVWERRAIAALGSPPPRPSPDEEIDLQLQKELEIIAAFEAMMS